MGVVLRYLKNRLAEPSTLRGLLLLTFGLTGYELSESDALTLVAAGQILAGAVGAALPDDMQP